MNKQNSRLDQRQQEQSAQESRTASETQAIEFACAEEAIRYDMAHTPVPPKVAERLHESLRSEPQSRGKPWWRRFTGQ